MTIYEMNFDTDYFEDDSSDIKYRIADQDTNCFIRRKSYFPNEWDNDKINFLQALNDRKEHYYLKAIRNLIKQRNFLSLLNQHANELIDNDEFSKEMENNPNLFIIDIDESLNSDNIGIISEIITKLNISLHDSDLPEIFSIDLFTNKTIFSHKYLYEE